MLSDKDIEFFYIIAADMFPGRKIPEWISKHPAIQDRKIKKVFPSFGLSNFKEKVDIEQNRIKHDLSTPFVWSAISGIKEWLLATVDHIEDMYKEFRYHKLMEIAKIKIDKKNKPSSEEELARLTKLEKDYELEIDSLWNEFRELRDLIVGCYSISISNKSIITEPNGKVKLVIASPLTLNGKGIAIVGESLFRVVGKIKSIVEVYLKKVGASSKLASLDSIDGMKEFHSGNIPISGENYIVFSSSGEDGAWDIATMSMRGISSCQRWGETPAEGHQFSPCIIGSIASNYVGIIYLTSGKDFEGKGDKMIRRCVVRFGIDTGKPKKENNPVIIIDKMYPTYSPYIANIFESSIKNKTSLQVINLSSGTTLASDYENIKLPEENLPGVVSKPRFSVDNEGAYFEGLGYESYQDSDIGSLKKDDKKRKDLYEKEYSEHEIYKYLLAKNKLELEKSRDRAISIFLNLLDEDPRISENQLINNLFSNRLYASYNFIIKNESLLSKPSRLLKKYFLSKCLKIELSQEDTKLNDRDYQSLSSILKEYKDIIRENIKDIK